MVMSEIPIVIIILTQEELKEKNIEKHLRNQKYSSKQITKYHRVNKATIINWVKHNK